MIDLSGIDRAALLAGSRSALARAISLIENERPGSAALSASLLPVCGRAHVVGITGVPGAGKSTLINALLAELLSRGTRIAVLAVDPSSPVTGGAVLGDRVRMEQQGGHERVFIRSVSARGHLGGLSRTAGRIIDVFDAAGFDMVIVETVGAGQSEVEISEFADTRIVVCPPGLGDEVQAIKAGILEIADILVVSKGDQPLAARTVRDLGGMLQLRRPAAWKVEVLATTATSGEGIQRLIEKIKQHAQAAGVGQRLKLQERSHVDSASLPVDDPAPDAAVLVEEIDAWCGAGLRSVLASVVRGSGLACGREGRFLAVAEDGRICGSVGTGAVDEAVAREAQALLAAGESVRLVAIGLPDGGRVDVLISRIGMG